MEDLYCMISDFIVFYAPVICGGMLGALGFRMRNRMGWKQTIGYLVSATIIGVIISLVTMEFTDFSNTIYFCISAGGGFLSNNIISEAKEIISTISDIVARWKIKK